MTRFIGLVLGALTLVVPSVAYSAEPMKAAADEGKSAKIAKAGVDFFEAKIRPVLVQKCYECHSAGAKSIKGGLVLDTREGWKKGGESGAAIVPGDADSSLLIEALQHEGLEMPPKEKLPDAVIADFVKWVKMGAPDPRSGKAAQVRKTIDLNEARKFWAYQAPQQPAPPTVKDSAWPRNSYDKFVLSALETKGLKPVADVDKVTLLRRVTFDLTGLPPTINEIDAFVKDKSPQAFEKVVDRLLASPQFGERWGRHWLDVARYAESTGKERNVAYATAWRYRDWVIDAVNADKPYDRFVLEQVAGDLLPAANDAERNSQMIATGFLALGPKGLNDKNAEQYLMDIVDEQIDVTCRAVLATTVACARCHDHKFDPIPTSDYYALAGIFRSTKTLAGVARGARDNNNARDFMALHADSSAPVANVASVPAKVETPEETAKLNEKKRAKLQAELAVARTEVEKLRQNKDEIKKNKNAKLRVRELVERVRELEKQLASGDSNGEKPKQDKGAEEKEKEAAPSLAQLAMGVQDASDPADTKIRIRGEPEEQGAVASRGFVTVLTNSKTPKVDPQHSGRLELAQWLTGKDNPLTARVMANRVWYHLFGAGLVETVDNFGTLGEEPSHPQLLDALAVDFMQNGWSVKKLIRSVVLSHSYQMSSDHDAANYAADPENRFVWRMNRRRLDAEAIRDSVLAASGQLDLARPQGSPYGKLGLGELGRKAALSSAEMDRNTRSVYLPLARGYVPEMLSIFDAADPSLVVGQREVTTVATQALYMMNSPFVMQHAEATARRVLAESSSDAAARADRTYQLILARPADANERQRAAKFVEEYLKSAEAKATDPRERELDAWAVVCQVLFSSAEFRYLY
jgi:cytochrome c553